MKLHHVVCNDENHLLATCDYGNSFTCSIHKDNIYGVQFHPVKSHKFGMQLLKNFGVFDFTKKNNSFFTNT